MSLTIISLGCHSRIPGVFNKVLGRFFHSGRAKSQTSPDWLFPGSAQTPVTLFCFQGPEAVTLYAWVVLLISWPQICGVPHSLWSSSSMTHNRHSRNSDCPELWSMHPHFNRSALLCMTVLRKSVSWAIMRST